jgi:hypothetical protein
VKANGSKKIGDGWATTCKMISDGPDGLPTLNLNDQKMNSNGSLH